MTISKSALAALFAAGAILAAPIASADEATTQTIGQAGKLENGSVVQTWTITGLQPSSDVIPHAVAGTLWEATATNEAVAGSVTPIVSNLNARAADGETYRALFQVATPQGVNPSTLVQGEKVTGKVYFDVTGASPDSVVYNAGGDDLLIWVKAAPAPSQPTGSAPAARPSAPKATTPAAPEGTAASATPAPVAGSQGTPVAETPADAAQGAPATEVPTGSQGTPITETPAGTEATEGTSSPTSPTASPAPAGSQGTPITEDAPGAEPVAGPEGTTDTEPVAGAQPATEPAGTPHGPQSNSTPTSVVESPVPHGTPVS